METASFRKSFFLDIQLRISYSQHTGKYVLSAKEDESGRKGGGTMMLKKETVFASGLVIAVFVCLSLIVGPRPAGAAWDPPKEITKDECVKLSKTVMAMPDLKFTEKEDVFRIQALGMDWDIGVMVYQPADPSKMAVGPDGKKIGFFLTHGGEDDWRYMEPLARFLTGKYGYKVVNLTYPGRLYLQDPSRNWPGDTIQPDGSVRTPIWKKDELITRDQYEVIKDLSQRPRYGTRTLAKAKPGTTFYYRMAGWPVGLEEGMKEACRRHLPAGEYSILVNGHSTGGPLVHIMLQRIANVVGMADAEGSPFGYINEQKHAWSGSMGKIGETGGKVATKVEGRKDPFDELYIRTWRDLARYRGPEALGREGAKALMRLPMLMEEVLDEWDKEKWSPRFKAEYMITHNIIKSLTEAAQVSAKRLNLNPAETEALVKRYVGYTRELSGPGAKPVPAILFNIAKDSRDHSPEVYKDVILPMYAAMSPAPRVRVIQYGAGVHGYMNEEKDLPVGIAPAMTKTWYDAIMSGYFAK